MAEGQEDQGGEKLKDPPKSYRSKVWSYYGFRDSRDLKEKATCRLCFSDITCKTGSTSSMTHHLKRKHGIDLVQDTDKTSDLTGLSSSSSKADCSKPLPSGQMTLTQFQLKKYTKSDPRKTNITKAIAGYLADDMRPYSTVQSDAFKYMIKVLDPRYELPSRTYFSEKVMPEIYQTVVARVKTQLDKAPSVAITTDSWTSRATENFVAVTAHFINKNWDVENYTLQTKKFSESHTSVNLATGLDDVVSEWKLFRGGCKPAITTDNAKNIVNAAKLADFNPHIPCFAHTLNLATQRGMKIPQMDRLLSRVRRVVSFFHKSTTATNHLKGMQSKLEIPEHKLLIDVQTRWNSSYEMLDRYLEQQAAIFATLVEMKKSVKDLVTLSDDDIRNVEDVIIVLKPLKTVTTMMCDSKHPTVSLIHPLKERLLKHLKPVDEDNQLMHAVKTAIYNDLLPRYTDTETLKFIHEASALDPRFKSLPYLEDQRRTEVHNSLTLKAVENNNVLPSNVKEEPECSAATDTPALPCLDQSDTEPPVKKKKDLTNQDSALDDIFGDVFLVKVEEGSSIQSKVDAEMKMYLDEGLLELSNNPLLWWRSREGKYPHLSRVAKYYLSVPATSVASERVFSTAGDIVSAQRACLSSNQVDMLVFLAKNIEIPKDLL